MIAQVLLPTFVVVGIGWALGRLAGVPSRPLAQAGFWVLSPALIFESLRTAQLPASAAVTVVAFTVVHYLGMFALSLPVGRRLFPSDRGGRAATSLLLSCGNCGNLGLPLLLFAYGQAGVDVGVVFLATNTVLLATLGVAIATWDGPHRWRAWGSLLRVPWPYAVVGALLARWAGFPPLLARATDLLAQGAIPLLLLLLGLELAQIRAARVARQAGGLSVLRLVGGGALAWILAWAFRADGIVRGSLIIEGSVPSAVNAFLLASQYDRRPDLAASVLLLSTLLSAGTLSLTLFLLGIAG
jgi:predicted permease